MDKDYLGDGVYVEHDGFQVMLWTDRGNGRETIYLEPSVFNALINYRKRILDKYAAPQPPAEE